MLAKVYRRAAEHIAMGWCQGGLEINDHRCLVSAVWQASREINGREMSTVEWRPVERVLARRGWMRAPASWNDVPGRTAEEVEAVLLAAAAEMEGA